MNGQPLRFSAPLQAGLTEELSEDLPPPIKMIYTDEKQIQAVEQNSR